MVLGYTYITMSGQVHPITWTIPHCVLVLKLIGKLSFYDKPIYITDIGLAYNFYDGNKKEVKQIITIQQVITFFFSLFLAKKKETLVSLLYLHFLK